jgi:microcompartment protein CcmL/EutN
MQALGFIEIPHICISAIAADIMGKAANVTVLGFEPTGVETIVVRIGADSPDAIEAALDAGEIETERLGAHIVARRCMARPDAALHHLNDELNTINPLYGGRTEFRPDDYSPNLKEKMKNNISALGILETQGFTASVEATDTMLKTADIQLVGKEKIGAAYVAITISGDVAAVTAAIDAGREAVGDLGKLIAAHVIARPHEDLQAILPANVGQALNK